MNTQRPKTFLRNSPTIITAAIALTLALAGCADGVPPAQTLPAPVDPTPTMTPAPTQDPAEAISLGLDERHVVSTTDPIAFTCDGGGEIEIRIDGAQVTASGNCEEIDIHANAISVSVENSDEIEIHGNSNIVTAMHITELEIEGNGNQVTSDQISKEIEVKGSDNAVSYASGDPVVEQEGNANAINRG